MSIFLLSSRGPTCEHVKSRPRKCRAAGYHTWFAASGRSLVRESQRATSSARSTRDPPNHQQQPPGDGNGMSPNRLYGFGGARSSCRKIYGKPEVIVNEEVTQVQKRDTARPAEASCGCPPIITSSSILRTHCFGFGSWKKCNH